MSPREKTERIRNSNKKRRLTHPTRTELCGRVAQYCTRRKLSKKAAHRIYDLVYNIHNDREERDLRTIPVQDRVPRSLEPEMTFSAQYWNIEHFATVRS